MLVDSVFVEDHVNVERGRGLAGDLVEEAQELLVPVALLDPSVDTSKPQ
jgi:hypothetical protein